MRKNFVNYLRNNFANVIFDLLNKLLSSMKHLSELLIKSAIAKIRAYEAQLREAQKLGNQPEADKLQTMIDHWRKILEDLLNK